MQDLEQTFLMQHLEEWHLSPAETRDPVPKGLVSRGPEFAKHFRQQADKCTLKSGIQQAMKVIKEAEVPIYGRFCGVGESAATECQGDKMIPKEDVCKDDAEGDFCCGYDVCR